MVPVQVTPIQVRPTQVRPTQVRPTQVRPTQVTALAGAGLRDDSLYLNRELSWLDFNARVLALASDDSVALLERIKFCAIFSSNLDEFFEVRVAGLKDQQAAGVVARSLDGRRPHQQLQAISAAVATLVNAQAELLNTVLLPALAERDIDITSWEALESETQNSLRTIFDENIFPVLTPLAVDPGHPFPYISNLSLNLAAVVRDLTTGERRFARVKVPPLLSRFVDSGDGRRLLPLELLIAAELSALFPGMVIEGSYPFRVTRNADLTVAEGEADDLLAAVEMELRRRRFGRAVRLEVVSGMPDEVLALLREELELEHDDVTIVDGLIDLSGLWALYRHDRPELKDEPWVPVTRPPLAPVSGDDTDLFAAMARGDVLVHHPYDSFTSSVERFIRQSALDPHVLTIKMTLYRTSGDSPVVRALIDAAERGTQVAVLVELKARFDEQANIAWARALEEAGVHVAYGVVGLKTHTKVAMVVRSEAEGLRRYCHVATGNYNSSTARMYEDIGLFSADRALGSDLTKLFNSLTGFARPGAYERLITAPTDMRGRMIELIDAEAPTDSRGPGRIVLKLNSLVDQPVIEALYRASNAGVSIDLIVRGVCCLRPGVVGLSENIRVRSIVGRFLEHSRIYHFANGDGDGKPVWLIGSADMMPRNLDRRVEALVPIIDASAQQELREIIDVQLADDVLAWVLGPDASWTRCRQADPEHPVDSQRELQQRTLMRAAAKVTA